MSRTGSGAAASALLVLLAVRGPASAGEPDLIGIGSAFWSKDRDALVLDVEYRPGWSLLEPLEPWASLRPFAAGLVTTRGQLWAGAGVVLEVPVGPVRLAVGSGPGLYVQGDGQDLGNDLVFRSHIELSWRYASGWRVGAAGMHFSNAGLGDRNPGSDVLAVLVQIPIGTR